MGGWVGGAKCDDFSMFFMCARKRHSKWGGEEEEKEEKASASVFLFPADSV